jgi:hypothetical protein
MGRVTFYLLKEDADGNVILDRDIKPAALSATKDGAPLGATFFSNGDGTYYFTANGSGIYSVLLNGTSQDEFRDVYIPDSDSLIETDVDNTTIQLNAGGKLEVINGDSLLYQADIIDSLTSPSTINPLSANQGRVLSASISLKQDADTTVLREEDIVADFTTGGTDKVQSAQSLLLDLSGTTFLSAQTTYNAAMRELDNRVSLTTVGGLYKSFLPFGRTAPLTSSMSTPQELATVDTVTNTRGYVVPRGGTIIGMSVLFNATLFTKVGSQNDPLQLFDVFKNGSIISAVQTEVEVSSTGFKAGVATSPTATFSAGDTFTVKWRYQEGFLDLFSIEDVSVLLEIRS